MKVNVITILILISVPFCNIIHPLEGDFLNYIHVPFEWEQEPDAIGYNLQISTDSLFNNLLLDVDEITTIYIDKNHLTWDNTYYWRIRPYYLHTEYGSWIDTTEFYIVNDILVNLDVNIYDSSQIQEGYVMYSQFTPYFAMGVIDMYGNEIWNTDDVFMNHVNKFGQLYGVQGAGVQFNYDEEILWSTPVFDVDSHEFKQIPNGNYMAFVPISHYGPIAIGDWTSLFQAQGYVADGIQNEFIWVGMKIVEWDDESGQEVWSWNPFEHFNMNDYDVYEGTWWNAFFDGWYDWMHSNAFYFDEEESAIYVSHRHLSRISKISYPSGEVIWNMGLPAEYNTGDDNICTDLLFSFQHNIQLMGNGDLLFFDNGNLSPMLLGDSNPTTRIRRIKVVEDSYCETVWQYDLPQNLFGLGMGSVQLLANGNYSIYTYGNGLNDPECSIFEITSDGEMVWKVTSESPNVAWYRAYKIPSIHPSSFSIVVDEYTIADDGPIVQLSDKTLDFVIYNKGGYMLEYKYLFSNLLNQSNPLFFDDEGIVSIEPYGNASISFPAVSGINNQFTQVGLSVWPLHHEYSKKELSYAIHYLNLSYGDLNYDSVVDILDIVIIINIVLNSEYSESADLNTDNVIDVLDIITMVNYVLEN